MTTKPPTTEIGTLAQVNFAGSALPGWQTFIDDRETTPELRWPESVPTFERMRNDSQIDGLITGIVWPIKQFSWRIDPNGARPDIVDALAEDLLLPIVGREADGEPRRKNRFSFPEHLETALDALTYGFYPFEVVGEIDDSGLWRLRKLAPRPPETVQEILVERDGGLKAIKQDIGGTFMGGSEIPVSRLVMYTWGKRGAQWVGRSILRSVYANWLIKDRLLRIDAIKHERNGMGVPVAEAPPGARDRDYDILMSTVTNLKAGETGGAVVPNGAKLGLVGTTGTLPDTIGSVVYHDQAMARRMMQMVAQLGQQGSTGNRALGDTLSGMFDRGLHAIAGWFAETFNAHVIEDWVDWNWQGETRVPRLVFSPYEGESSTEEIIRLIDAGVITMDDDLEDQLRARHGLPARGTARPKADPPTPPANEAVEASRRMPDGRTVRLARVAAPDDAEPYSLPDRALRRRPYVQEVRAAVDWKGLDEFHDGAVDDLVDAFADVRAQQIDELADMIRKAESVSDFIGMRPETDGGDILEKKLLEVLEQGAAGALDEAGRQGGKTKKIDLGDSRAVISERAQVSAKLMAESIGQAAAQRGLSMSGSSASMDEIADDVAKYLSEFSDAYVKDRMTGLVSAATNEGRMAVFGELDGIEMLYSSELLDAATCSACAEIDGTEYTSRVDAAADYPSGGYRDCAGGDRCRGTIIAVYEEDSV